MTCPNCHSVNVVKNGSIHNGKPKFSCKDCRRQFVENPENIIPQDKRGSSRVLVESNAGMYHLSALNSLWRIYRIEDKAIK